VAYVLIIDDDPDASDIVATYLKKAGHTVQCVLSGRDALSALIQKIPDAILLDLLMPHMDGFEVLETIRSYLRWSAIPVAILTAYPEDPRLWHIRSQGVTHVFVKSRVKLEGILKWVNEGSERVNSPTGTDPAPQAGV